MPPSVVVYRNLELRYHCVRERLPPELAHGYVPLAFDDATRDWVDAAYQAPHGPFVIALRSLAGAFLSDYDANGLLGTYPMRLLGPEQWRLLLGERPGGRLLDVGAGDGHVTSELAKMFDEVVVTETSKLMARRLEARGYRVLPVDLASEDIAERDFDAISMLNVIDRTARPVTLLERVTRRLAPNGILIVAVPLPLRAHVHVGPRTADPEELLPVADASFEAGVCALATRYLAKCGLFVESFTRAPYLSRGSHMTPLHVLDDVVMVCRRAESSKT